MQAKTTKRLKQLLNATPILVYRKPVAHARWCSACNCILAKRHSRDGKDPLIMLFFRKAPLLRRNCFSGKIEYICNELFGEVSEWLKEPVSKTGVPRKWDRGFESHPLRQRGPRNYMTKYGFFRQ